VFFNFLIETKVCWRNIDQQTLKNHKNKGQV